MSDERPSLLFDFATSWLIHHKVLLPGCSTLIRIIGAVRNRSQQRLWRKLSHLPSLKQRKALKTLLKIPEGKRVSRLDAYRKGPCTVSTASLNTSISRYIELQDFGFAGVSFNSIPPVRFKALARHSSIAASHKILRMRPEKQTAILAAFVKSYEILALDDALDVFDMLVTTICRFAKTKGTANRMRTIKDLDKVALALVEACKPVCNQEINGDRLRKVIFDLVNLKKLLDSIDTVEKLARPPEDNFNQEMVDQYKRVRKFLPNLLERIQFKATSAGQPVLDALNYLIALGLRKRKQYIDDAPSEIITKAWKNLVYDEAGRLLRRPYVLCALERLQDSLRRRDVYVEKSDRWGDPRLKLLSPERWDTLRVQVCKALGRPVSGAVALDQMTEQLNATYLRVSARFDKNPHVRIDRSTKNPSLTITNLDKLEEPESLNTLREQIVSLLPKVNITELLLEINAHTSFAEEFTHVSEANSRVKDLHISICAVLLSEACNIDLEVLVRSGTPALTKSRLTWVKQNYIRKETLIKANARLVDYQKTLPLVKSWGSGDVGSADGLRFVTPVKTINSGPNRKYYNAGRGITWYNFVSGQYAGFHGIVIPGTLRDSIFILQGLLEQETSLGLRGVMTDTAGASDIVFGLFWLLGYQFSPRLADAGESVCFRIDKEADYGVLNEIARGKIKTEKVHQQWDEMMRVAGSLKLGTVQASELIKSLLKSDKPSALAQGIIELGRINRTLYLLDYIDDEDYRPRILTQLNKGESRHALARAVCHGKRGEIRKRYTEGQEDQLNSLGLVINAITLWNTIYIQKALEYLRENKVCAVKEEDVARLSPLLRAHINVLGRYSFALDQEILDGQLRELNQEIMEEFEALA